MKKRLLYLLMICGLVYSCKKEKLPIDTDAGNPVFYVKGNVNGVPMKLEAGVNDYKMVATHYLDENNLYVFQGDLKQASCTSGCGMAVSIMINDFKFSDATTAIDINKAIRYGSYGFDDEDIKVLYDCSFAPATSNTGGPYTWISYVNGDTSLTTGYTASRTLEAGKNAKVSFLMTDPNGSASQISQRYKIGSPLQANISMSYEPNNMCRFTAATTAKGSLKYYWDFGDQSTSTEAAPVHYFSLKNDQLVQFQLTDDDGNICVASYLVPAENNPNPNFSATFKPRADARILSAITVKFTDQNGVTYTSSDLDQPAGSKFEIISVDDYKTNDQNELTKKVKINFNCSFTGSNGPVNITNGEAVIAVSYK